MYNLLIGGAAGQGIDTAAAILEKLLKRSGYYVFTVRDFMSRVRGGQNFSLIRFGAQPVRSHSARLDGIIALNDETVALHKDKLSENGFILCDDAIRTDDPRALHVGLDARAKALGNPRVSGSIAVGAVLRLFGETLEQVPEVFRQLMKPKILDINLKAVQEGYGLVEPRFPHEKGDAKDDLILSGSEAVALGAAAAGLRFYSAYPMSPSTAVMEALAKFADRADIVVEQAEDEIAAVNMAIGASYAGARAMTGSSGGGFCLMVEALGFAGIAEIPLVLFDMQRPGPATGLPTRTEQSDLKFVISASQGEFPRMVIALRDAKDAFYQTARAFDLAEKYQLPVILLGDQYLGDASWTTEPFDVDGVKTAQPAASAPEGEEYLRYRLTESGVSPRLIPGQTPHLVAIDSDEHDEAGKITESAEVRMQQMDKRMKKLEGLRAELQEPAFFGADEFDTLLLSWGSTQGPIAEAVETLNRAGGHYAALVFGDVWPLPQRLLTEKAAKAKTIIDVEQNATGQLADLVREQTGIHAGRRILKYDGRQISGEEIVSRIREGEQK